jgi:hypothetical protein
MGQGVHLQNAPRFDAERAAIAGVQFSSPDGGKAGHEGNL